MSIKKIERADGTRYQVYGQRNGRKAYLGTYPTRKEALGADEDHRVTQRKVRRGEVPPELDTRRLFRASVKTWLTSIEKQPSCEEYERRIDVYVMPRFGDVPIADIRKSHLLAWRDELASRVSNGTVNTIWFTASAAFAYFVSMEWIAVNPCAGVKALKQDSRVFPWLESPDAITRLLAELPYKWRTLVAFLVGTGCRLDEALRLRWDDVDLDHRLVTLRKTKSGKVRRVPIFDSVLPVLKQMRIERGGNVLLWPSKNGRKSDLSAPRKPFKAAAARAGLPPQLRLHDLRHTFASLFLVDGGDIFKLSRILGHSSVVITERTYAHLKRSAFEEDYGRVRFVMPGDKSNVIAIGR